MSSSHYETPDVYLASYLLCQGASFVEFERVGPRRTMFRFTSDEYLHSLLRVYWMDDRILVTPTQLFDALRRLKSRIRQRPQSARPRSSFPAATPHTPEAPAEGSAAPSTASPTPTC